MNVFHLLVCTVGGSPEPLVASLLEWRPSKVVFVPSTKSREQIDTILLRYAEKTGTPLNPGQYTIRDVPDAEDIAGCLGTIRRCDLDVREWIARGDNYQVVADFTGGTKCMSAALALQARRWPARYSYVGGTRRSKDGVGAVETGSEHIVHWENPWNALGYQAIEDACLLFDRHAFAPATKLLAQARDAADDGTVKRMLSTFHQLCEGYAKWDIFRHRDACSAIDDALKNVSDLEIALGGERFVAVRDAILSNRNFIGEIAGRPPSRASITDLLANARRRGDEGRYDDSVARLYRAIEAVAQLALDAHGISHKEGVALECIPARFRCRWESRADNGRVLLGLQDSYELLEALGDCVGKEFRQANLHGVKSPLMVRNRSILAHGFEPVSKDVFAALWKVTIQLGRFSDGDLPQFPHLTDTGAE